MRSYYGVCFPEFWTGQSGRELRASGKDAQLLGLYLISNRHANMIGLYRLLLDDIRHETGIGLKGLERGFSATHATSFATYDVDSSFVWVHNMARFRLGLPAGEALSPEDNRVLAVNRLYHGIEPNPFLGEFFDANHKILRLKKRRDSVGLWSPLTTTTTSRPYKGLTKGLISQVTDIRDQDQGSGPRDQEKAPLARQGRENNPAENRRVIRALVVALVKQADPNTGFADLKDLAKTTCAEKDIAYDADTVGSALEQALARRDKAS